MLSVWLPPIRFLSIFQIFSFSFFFIVDLSIGFGFDLSRTFPLLLVVPLENIAKIANFHWNASPVNRFDPSKIVSTQEDGSLKSIRIATFHQKFPKPNSHIKPLEVHCRSMIYLMFVLCTAHAELSAACAIRSPSGAYVFGFIGFGFLGPLCYCTAFDLYFVAQLIVFLAFFSLNFFAFSLFPSSLAGPLSCSNDMTSSLFVFFFIFCIAAKHFLYRYSW